MVLSAMIAIAQTMYIHEFIYHHIIIII